MSSPQLLARVVLAARLCGAGFYIVSAALTFLIGAPPAIRSEYSFIGVLFGIFIFAYIGLTIPLVFKLDTTIWQVSSKAERACRLIAPLAGVASILCWPNSWLFPSILVLGLMVSAFFERRLQVMLSTVPGYYRPEDWK